MTRNIIRRASVTGTMVAVGAIGAFAGYGSYTHPDLTGRPTLELRREAIALTRDHANEPTVLRWPALARQEAIVAELAKRTKAEIAMWQAEEATEQALAESTGTSSPALLTVDGQPGPSQGR
jgi:hypothetical protein